MLIQQKLGNILNCQTAGKTLDWLPLQWYELNKRVQRKKTTAGKELSLRFLQENPALTQGDILADDAHSLIAVEVVPCDSLVIVPATIMEAAAICYEIGNKHLPLFFDHNSLLAPFEMPLFNWLTAQGYTVGREARKLLNPLKTTVAAHANASTSLLSKILKMTAHD